MQGQNFQAPINIATLELPNSANYFEHEGQYKMIITKAEFRATRSNQANIMLALTLKCIEGEHMGKTGTHNLNLYNQNPDAAKIAHAELAAYATAIGEPMLQNTAQLCGKPFCVYVGVSKQQDPNDPNKSYTNNKFSDWAYADGTPIVKGQFGSPAGQQQQGYAQPGAAPVAPAPVAPAPVAPAVPQAPAAPQQGYAAPAAPAAPQAPAAPAYAAPAAPQAPAAAPQQQAAPAAPFAPPAAAPFAPPQQ